MCRTICLPPCSCLCCNYILHEGLHIVSFCFGCCTSNCNLPSSPIVGEPRLSRNPLPNETEPGSNLAASQSFPARRRENKMKSSKFRDMRLEFWPMIGQVCAFGVRAARCKFSFDQSLLWSKACRKDFFDTQRSSVWQQHTEDLSLSFMISY